MQPKVMPPKKRASSSTAAPKTKSGVKSKAKAQGEIKEDLQAKLDQEVADMFERYAPEGTLESVLKLKEFANLIQDENRKKCMIWGDDPVKIIRDEWKKSGGAEKRELKFDDFKAWWPAFSDAVEKECEAKVEAEASVAAAKKKELEETYGHDGIWRIKFAQLKEAFDQAKQKGKTPLVIDNTPGFRTDVFFQYSNAHVLETKKWIVENAKGSSVDEILQEERRRFLAAQCFQHGKIVMFRLSNSAPDLRNKFNTDEFPTLALLDAKQVGSIVAMEDKKNIVTTPFYKMATDNDEKLELEAFGVKDGFQVVVVTQFDEADYAEFLEKMIPLELMQPIKPETD